MAGNEPVGAAEFLTLVKPKAASVMR